MVKKATRISRFVAAVEDQPVVVGLDVHKKTYSVALFSKRNDQRTIASVIARIGKGPVCGDSVEKSQHFGWLDDDRELARQLPSSCRRLHGNQFSQFAEVLGGCSELELFGCAFGSSEPHHPQANVSFKVGK